MDTSKMMETIEEKVAIFGQKIGNQKHMSAIRDGFATFIPFIIAGSFALLFSSVIVDSNSLLATMVGATDSAGWAKFSFYVSPIFIGITDATMAFFSVYIAFLFGYFLAGAYGDNKIIGAGIGVACFMVLQPIAAGTDAHSSTYYFGSTGIIFSMIGGLGGPTIFHHLSSNGKFSITMPDKVPPAIADSFKALFPLIFTILIFGLIQPIWGGFAFAIGLGANWIDHNYYILNGKIWYSLEEGVDASVDKVGSIVVEQGTGLYTFMNLVNMSMLQLVGEGWATKVEFSSIFNVLNEHTVIEDWMNEWFTGQIVSIIGKEDLWFNVSIDWEASTADSNVAGVAGFIAEQIKVIDPEWYYIINVVYVVLVLPVQNASVSAPFIFFGLFMIAFFWFFGIHGPSVMSPILAPLWTTGAFHNLEVLASFDGDLDAAMNSGLLLVFTQQTADSFCIIGGTGATMGLTIALLIFSKSPTHQEIAKISATPQLFQVNEPILFGLPIIINPVYAIPYMLVMPIAGVFIYYITLLGLINPTTIMVPWTTPFLISGFVTTQDWRFFIWMPIIFLWMVLCYLPFILFDVKQQVKEELNSDDNDEYKNINLKITKIEKKINSENSEESLKISNKKDKSVNQQMNKDQIKLDELILQKRNIEKKYSDLMKLQIYVRKNAKNFESANLLIQEKYNLKLNKKIAKKEGNKIKISDEIKRINKELIFLIKEQKILNKIDINQENLESKISTKETKIKIKTNKIETKIAKLKNKKDKNGKILGKNEKITKLQNVFENYIISSKEKTKVKKEKLLLKANKVIDKKENYLLKNN